MTMSKLNKFSVVLAIIFGSVGLCVASDANEVLAKKDTLIEQAEAASPDVLIRTVSDKVIQAIKDLNGKGTFSQIANLVDTYIIPVVNFKDMTASAVGPAWNKATLKEQSDLQQQFKTLLIRTYAGALQQVSDQKITVRPLDKKNLGKEVVVNSILSSSVSGGSQPLKIKYRCVKEVGGEWKIVDLSVMDVWLMQTYRSQFKELINGKGISDLIAALTKLNEGHKAG
jgi:phospholipid transport system substrate-binding protein